MSQSIEQAIMANAASFKGFTFRFVARTLGLPWTVVQGACNALVIDGKLEQYEHNGEIYYRLNKQQKGGV